ncbi:MAG TPA: nitroreductase family protein [Chitinophagales bacterium]|nr:nitroreductase family protein [Chitinophagales bacterium]HMU97970.1 nitroreductase family protein [Chitinophagales bacterium]HMV02250.1 nitroreductase family protein [Chitinophagales bacterium]HMW94105.1 nitroreductase family protein [Chitinophagales bacterium]HMY41535.1 nitroreductase family protein [Chitinophagales bacterium]
MQDNSKVIDELIDKRRSVRIYDDSEPLNDVVVRKCLERATLAPSSDNLQLWEFYRVKSKNKLQELAKYCYGQKAASTAQELVVFVTRTDKWQERAEFNLEEIKKGFPKEITNKEQKVIDYYEKSIAQLYSGNEAKAEIRIIAHKSCALAAQMFMLSIAAEGFDTCPMEGFQEELVKQFLNLPDIAEICMVISVGKAKPEGIYNRRIRVPNDAVIFEI